MMVRDGLMLHRITHAVAYRDQALKTAVAMLKRYSLPSLEGMCPVYVAQAFYNLDSSDVAQTVPVVSELGQYANWVAKKMSKTGVFLKAAYRSHCDAPNPQSGATGVLILRLPTQKRKH